MEKLKEKNKKNKEIIKSSKALKDSKDLKSTNYDPKIEQIYLIEEKQYYEYTEEEIAYLKLKNLYQELKIISIPSFYGTHFYQQNLDNSSLKTQIEIEKELNDFFLSLNITPNADLSYFDEIITETDFVKDCFIQVNEILSKLKNRRYLAHFFGNWDEIKKIDLIKMMIKLKNEINNRTGVLLIYESPFDNLYHESFHEPLDKKKRMETRKVSKKTKNNTIKNDDNQDQDQEQNQKQDLEQDDFNEELD